MADRIPLIVNSTVSQIQEVPTGDVVSLPNNTLKFGTGLNISYTDAGGQGSKIIHSGTDDLRLQIAGNQIIFEKTDGVNFISCTHSTGVVNISHAGNGVKIATKSTGVDITGVLDVSDDITAFASSDATLKENITPISNAVDKVRSISGNTFTWNEKSVYNGEEGTGIIAQEIEALGLPGVTETRENGTKAVRYDRLVPLLIEAIKELDTKVKSLEG